MSSAPSFTSPLSPEIVRMQMLIFQQILQLSSPTVSSSFLQFLEYLFQEYQNGNVEKTTNELYQQWQDITGIQLTRQHFSYYLDFFKQLQVLERSPQYKKGHYRISSTIVLLEEYLTQLNRLLAQVKLVQKGKWEYISPEIHKQLTFSITSSIPVHTYPFGRLFRQITPRKKIVWVSSRELLNNKTLFDFRSISMDIFLYSPRLPQTIPQPASPCSDPILRDFSSSTRVYDCQQQLTSLFQFQYLEQVNREFLPFYCLIDDSIGYVYIPDYREGGVIYHFKDSKLVQHIQCYLFQLVENEQILPCNF